MTNFDYLKKEKDFDSFVDIAIVAEKTYKIDVSTCIINCRRALEAGIKWMYSVDADLDVPYQDNLHTLMNTRAFKSIMDDDIWKRIEFIRRYGNEAVHTSTTKTASIAKICLRNLFYFTDFIAYCYGDNYEEREFDESLLEQEEVAPVKVVPDVDLEALIAENKSLKEELSSRRIQQQETYVAKPLDLSEFKTRKLYIDAMLMDAGWVEGKDWINEVELEGMPNKSEVGYADYVLYDDMNIPLAVIEAKRSCKDPAVGRQQAKLYADLLEKKYKRRPVILITNGFETRIIDNDYPERRVSSIYSKRDLEKYFNLRRTKSHLNYIAINKNIAGRYYQEAAVRAVCEAFDKGNRRKALLVMATGSGKTRTVISLVDVLLNNGWIKNILFLADRNSLVTQAKRSFVNLLPDLSATNLVEDKENYNAHAVFSTYQTMIGCIDTIKDEGKKLFTCGHFDLIICDEAHRSIYNKYRDIFSYFDAPLVGLTATPKDEIDKNTYEVFELENGIPTYGYELAQAVKDEFLVDYKSIECSTEFMKNGIHWDELDNDEKEEYEDTFVDDEGNVPEVIRASAINQYVFNKDTVRKVLATLFKYGIHIDYGQKIGKTIIFAKNHKHAEFILEIFNKVYPELKGYALAPEFKFPKPLYSSYEAIVELLKRADELKLDSDHVMVMGHSAGGYISSCLTLMDRERQKIKIKGAILDYPPLRQEVDTELRKVADPSKAISENRMLQYINWYYNNFDELDDILASPLLADLHDLPKALVISAEYDALKNEEKAYADKMREAGGDVEYYEFKNCRHGFTHECFNEYMPKESCEAWNLMSDFIKKVMA